MTAPNDESHATTTDGIAVFRIYAGDYDSAAALFHCNGKQIAVSVSDPGRPSPESRLIRLLNQAASDESDDEFRDITNEIFDIILDAGRDLIHQVAPIRAPPEGNGNSSNAVDLHSLLYPERHHFLFKGDGGSGRPVIVPIHASEAPRFKELPADELDFDGDDEDRQALRSRLGALPTYTTREIQVVEAITSAGYVSRVRVASAAAGTLSADMLCKATDDGRFLSWAMFRRELACLLTLRENASSALATTIRTPPLVGLVSHPETGRIVGLLRQWVPGRRLSDMWMGGLPAAQKQKWATQIRQSVDGLHGLGIVWGDCKTSNVIIGGYEGEEEEEDDGDAWLIDFGGDLTAGSDDEDEEDTVEKETVEGDELAVGKILEHLGMAR